MRLSHVRLEREIAGCFLRPGSPRFEGGDPGREATERGVAVIENALTRGILPTELVSHGNLMALILRHFDTRFGFEEWQALSNPDVFQIAISAETANIVRFWVEP